MDWVGKTDRVVGKYSSATVGQVGDGRSLYGNRASAFAFQPL